MGSNSITLKGAIQFFNLFAVFPPRLTDANHFDVFYFVFNDNRLALANEKRRKRRESHNAVERRRRDNINEKIQELALLLPEEWLEGGTSPGGNGAGKGPSIAGLLSGTVSGSALGAGGLLDEDSKEIKANKGVILRNSVEYIKCVWPASSRLSVLILL